MIIGIDPGKRGGIGVIDGINVNVYAMSTLAGDVDAKLLTFLLKNIIGGKCVDLVVVEKCHSMPGEGVASSHSFGRSIGIVLGVCAGLELNTIEIPPQKWKQTIIPNTARDKQAAIDYCKARWPHVSLVAKGGRLDHDGLADALCIARYAEKYVEALNNRKK